MIVIRRLIDILPYQLEKFPRLDSICGKSGGEWQKYSTVSIMKIADDFSLGLLKLGFKQGDKFAIISENRPEWNIVDLGIMQMGGIDVPVYPTMNEDEYAYIFNDSEVKLVFVSGNELYEKVHRVLPRAKSIMDVYTFDLANDKKHWTAILSASDNAQEAKLKLIEGKISPEDIATIIYTSGTTGIPKGVMLTHHNIISNILSLHEIIPINNKHRMMSFLPISHIFERTSIYFYLSIGGAIYYAESMDKIIENFSEVRPNYFTTVPRLLEKVYERIMEKGRGLTGLKKAIFGWAVNLANHYDPKGKNNLFYRIRLKVAGELVFKKWQQALGGEIKGIISGAATLQPRLARIFTAAGIPVREGYGLTETSPVLTCNRFEDKGFYLGTVGMPIPGVEIKINKENGEVLAKGENVFKGYYNNPEWTKKAFDGEGWFHTGDVGELIEGKYLKITDRIKEIFKTSGGKFIAPLPIENKMKESWFIKNIMVIGENRKFTAALIVPDTVFIFNWLKKKKGAENISFNDILRNAKVKERVWKDVQKYNKRFSHIEQIKKFEFSPHDWTTETGELTPTLKLKRKVILHKYKDLIDKIYETNTEQNNDVQPQLKN